MKCTGWDSPCESENATRRRTNTQYVDEERNFATLCDSCWIKCKKYWSDMWADYYRDCR